MFQKFPIASPILAAKTPKQAKKGQLSSIVMPSFAPVSAELPFQFGVVAEDASREQQVRSCLRDLRPQAIAGGCRKHVLILAIKSDVNRGRVKQKNIRTFIECGITKI